jgi:hypothetical protein
MTLLASGKTGANKYDLKAVDATKILPDLDMRLLAETEQRMMEETLGWSPSGNLGASAAFDADLSIITKGNIADYIKYRAQMIQTYVANNSFLAVNASSTANAITLEPAKISDISSPNGTNYAKTTSLPFAYRDNLSFCFKAKDTNTNAVQIQITGLTGLSGLVDLVDEAGNALPANSIIAGRYYRIFLTGTSGTKKAVLQTTNVSNASTTTKGIVELLTNAELAAGTDTTRAATAAAIASLYPDIVIGSQNSISFPIKDGGAFKKFTIKSGVTGSLSSGNPGTTITFASAFTGGVISASIAATTYTGVAEANNCIPTLTLSSIVLTVGGGSAQPYRWIVFGYDL